MLGSLILGWCSVRPIYSEPLSLPNSSEEGSPGRELRDSSLRQSEIGARLCDAEALAMPSSSWQRDRAGVGDVVGAASAACPDARG